MGKKEVNDVSGGANCEKSISKVYIKSYFCVINYLGILFNCLPIYIHLIFPQSLILINAGWKYPSYQYFIKQMQFQLSKSYTP